ncbi:MAG: N-acetylmuramoyl-L-alanine amidase [Candidatus Sumerlaeota bacterium]
MLSAFLLVGGCGIAQPPAATPAAKTATKEDPAKPFAGVIIGTDAGHGGQSYSRSYTAGTRGVDSKISESELNLKCETELAKLFEEAGATVIRTRTAEQRVSPEGSSNKQELHARLEIFENANVHFFVAVHHNAGPGAPGATGHTAIYKLEVDDDHIYKALAQDINDALKDVVPGPERELIKGDYHLTRETDIPGTIVESGFMTNSAFDKLSQEPDYPKKEAQAIFNGALKFWQDNKVEVTKMHDELMAKRKLSPPDPNTLNAMQLNPKYQKEIAAIVKAMDPSGKHDPAMIATYVENYKKAYVKTDADRFTVTGSWADGKVVLAGNVPDRKYHDDIINALIEMNMHKISNKIKFPDVQQDEPAATPSWKATPAPPVASPTSK